MRRRVHEACVDRSQFCQTEETGTMLGGLELERCRLEKGYSASSVLDVEFVTMMKHGCGESLARFVVIGAGFGHLLALVLTYLLTLCSCC